MTLNNEETRDQVVVSSNPANGRFCEKKLFLEISKINEKEAWDVTQKALLFLE